MIRVTFGVCAHTKLSREEIWEEGRAYRWMLGVGVELIKGDRQQQDKQRRHTGASMVSRAQEWEVHVSLITKRYSQAVDSEET